MNNIKLVRHENKYNKYVMSIVNQQEIICLLDNTIPDTNSYDEFINNSICNKNMLVFVLTSGNDVIGFLALDNFDWENRNCRLKGGVFPTHSNLVEDTSIISAIKQVLDFCKVQLRINKIWGTLSPTSFVLKTILIKFKLESTSSDHETLYLGHVS